MRKLLIALALSLMVGTVHSDETIGFKKGDRVVFVGPTFVERTARFGHLETALTLAMPEKELIFRNLGWSADTVMGESRGYEKPQSGYANLLRSIRESQSPPYSSSLMVRPNRGRKPRKPSPPTTKNCSTI